VITNHENVFLQCMLGIMMDNDLVFCTQAACWMNWRSRLQKHKHH